MDNQKIFWFSGVKTIVLIILLFPLNTFTQSPLKNRARAYCDKNNFKLAIDNFGRFVGVAKPFGLWKDFQYISNLSFILGVPGSDKSGKPYPWAIGPKKVYDVKKDRFRTIGNDSTYWGPTVSESWFGGSRYLNRTDWEAIGGLNNPQSTAGAFYGAKGLYTFPEDSTPLIATSHIPETWPVKENISFWPGHWAVDPNDPERKEELRNTFISDEDIFFAFNDRYATRDDAIDQGYPIGITVTASCHVFSDSLAADMIFFDLIMHNTSPYNYQDVFAGFYFDADIYHTLADGSYSGRTNDDDMAGFDRTLGLTYIYDLDGDPFNPYVQNKKLAFIGLKFLKTPVSSYSLDLDDDGLFEINPGDQLGVTGFHWFDWYMLPGVVVSEENDLIKSSSNKEAIQYKILSGDTTDLNTFDSLNFFHPSLVNGQLKLNPHFDALDALQREHPQGLDCVVMLSTGPFDLPSGIHQPLSFCLIAAQNEERLIQKAILAQNLCDDNYQLLPSVQQRIAAAMKFKLEQNFPNPFNHRTKIVFTIHEMEEVRLEIFDIRGRKIAKLVNGVMRKGQHTITFDASRLSSGVYFYRLTVGHNFIATKKMLLVH